MTWTTPTDIQKQVERLWNSGQLLTALAANESIFPRKMRFRGPGSSELASRFDDVREWIRLLRDAEPSGYRLMWREVNHPVIGRNALPAEVWIDSFGDAIGLIGRTDDAERYVHMLRETEDRCPELRPWLVRSPLRALDLNFRWPHLLDVVVWVKAHPMPGVYLRQVDVPGIHSKFIEAHQGVLSELLELALPPDSMCVDATGGSQFCRRFGFRDKPLRVRFRILDPRRALLGSGTDQDIAIPAATFARLDPRMETVFITENEINFLAFPMVPDSLVIFGSGYGFEALSDVPWLERARILYWGDIDTHGFAILDQLRQRIPWVESFLMDRETLMAHKPFWAVEPKPIDRDLPNLNPEESSLYDELRRNRLGHHVRFEQELIGFRHVEQALNSVCRSD